MSDDMMQDEIRSKYGHWRGAKIADVLPVLEKISAGFHSWYWGYNSQCKYLRISIDTRDGGYVIIRDRDDNLLSIADVEVQLGRKPSQNCTSAAGLHDRLDQPATKQDMTGAFETSVLPNNETDEAES